MTTEKKIEDYLPFLIGCDCLIYGEEGIKKILGFYYPEVWTDFGDTEPNGIDVFYPELNKVYAMNFGQVQPLLRSLSSITDDEIKELKILVDERTLIMKVWGDKDSAYKPAQFIYLISKHFDIFDLIPAGLAIDSTTLKQEIK